MPKGQSPPVRVHSRGVGCGLFTPTSWGGIITPLFGPPSVEMVFVDPAADLQRTRRRVAGSSCCSWVLAVATCSLLLLAPLPGAVWLHPLLAGTGAEAVFLTIRLVGRLGRAPACRTICYRLTTRRRLPGGGRAEVGFVVPAGLSEFTCALDLAAENYRLGFLRQPGWDKVRCYIWSYLELNVRCRELVGLGFAAREIDRICYVDSERTTVGFDSIPGAESRR